MSHKTTVMAVVNQKGGTGKTTTCENLGVGLAKEGKNKEWMGSESFLFTYLHRVWLTFEWERYIISM